MVAAGEQSGTLDSMLGRVADFQQDEVERVVSALVKLFEPLMLLLMGGVVLFIVMAILLPMLSMNQLV
jgi:general secretion pathway protein F